jgi:hypothetical protein
MYVSEKGTNIFSANTKKDFKDLKEIEEDENNLEIKSRFG